MKNDAKQKPGMLSEDEVKLWDFYLSVGVMGAEELRKELSECARSQEDRYKFWGFHNKNSEWSANWLCDEIRSLEKAGLDPKSRWYIDDGKVLNDNWAKKRVPFSSFRCRYKRIPPIALPSELNTLGKSYVHAYGMSKDVHFTPHDTSSNFDEEQVFRGVDRVGLLILNTA